MKVAFYYHIPFYKIEQNHYLPDFIALFLIELSNCVEELHLFLHSSKIQNNADYKIEKSNIRIIDLGEKPSSWKREFFSRKLILPFASRISLCDVLLVRAPSPLAAYFQNHVNLPIAYLIVGDNSEGGKMYKIKTLRNVFVKIYIFYNNHVFLKKLKSSLVIVNSPTLLEKYKPLTKNMHMVYTTTLQDDDFYRRRDTCKENTLKLLYTGRFERSKGLLELLNATKQLVEQNINIELNIVGWEEGGHNKFTNQMIDLVRHLKISKFVVIHGKKKLGEELNSFYRISDIFIMPSYHEGFPRTIWESMANSCPVIATKVGGIPKILEDQKNAILIQPKSTIAIVNAVKKLLENAVLRQRIMSEGYSLSEKNTIKNQSQKLSEIIANYVQSISN